MSASELSGLLHDLIAGIAEEEDRKAALEPKSQRPGGAVPIGIIKEAPSAGFCGAVPVEFPFAIQGMIIGGAGAGSATVDVRNAAGVSVVGGGVSASGTGLVRVAPEAGWARDLAGADLFFYVVSVSGWDPLTMIVRGRGV